MNDTNDNLPLKLTRTEIDVFMDRFMGSVNRAKVLKYLQSCIITNPDGNIGVNMSLKMPYVDMVELAELRDIKEKQMEENIKALGLETEEEGDG